MRNKIILSISILIALISCKGKGTYGKMNEAGANEPEISVTRPIIGEAILYKDYPGYLKAYNNTQIVARVNGYIDKVCYSPGDKVSKGTLLFVIEPTLYQNAVNQAQAELNSSIAQYDYATNNYERMKEAAQSDAVSQIDLLQAQSQLLESKASVDNAKASLSTAQTNLDYCYVKAPFAGVVSVNIYGEGTYVGGSSQPITLASIYDESKMYANFSVSDNLYIETGKIPDSVTVSFNGAGKKSYPAKIDYQAPNVELSTGTINVRAILQNDGHLKDGLYVNINLPYKIIDDAIMVNSASVGVNQAGKYMYAVNDSSIVNLRHVSVLGTIKDTLSIISHGIEPTDRYVTKAMLKVRNGMKIKPVEQ